MSTNLTIDVLLRQPTTQMVVSLAVNDEVTAIRQGGVVTYGQFSLEYAGDILRQLRPGLSINSKLTCQLNDEICDLTSSGRLKKEVTGEHKFDIYTIRWGYGIPATSSMDAALHYTKNN
ncbi:hypothetical protein [Proteus mirabilis]|uniref:hypothetical protein n=1 Tax=Proteus mirabilis TaxID=584 RepID=UPI0034D463FF